MAKYRVFFGTYSKGAGKGLFLGEFDGETGKLRLIDSIDIENPSYLQLYKNILYGVSETSVFKEAKGGSLFSVSVNCADSADNANKMNLISMEGTNGRSPCHLCVQDNFIFAANYSEGSLSIFKKDECGAFKPSYLSVHHYGKGAVASRQESSHIHFAAMTPDNKYLAVCDLGLDKVFLYPYSGNQGLSSEAKTIECPAGSGPRHLTFSSCGKYLYILTELGNTVLAYGYNDGNAVLLHEISTLPEDFSGRSTAAAIHVSPDGNFLAASNRGHDSIAVFNILPDGTLAPPKYIMTQKEPRDFRYAPNGKWILSANQGSGAVTVYQIEPDGENNNIFTEKGSVALPSPVCVLFEE